MSICCRPLDIKVGQSSLVRGALTRARTFGSIHGFPCTGADVCGACPTCLIDTQLGKQGGWGAVGRARQVERVRQSGRIL